MATAQPAFTCSKLTIETSVTIVDFGQVIAGYE